MFRLDWRRAFTVALAVATCPVAATGQSPMSMPTVALGGGWTWTGMGQFYPVVTLSGIGADDTQPFRETGVYLTQPALMMNVESPGQRIVLRTTLNLEGLTQEDGEITLGGWGEGFLDKRHPHTLLHELMLSFNVWESDFGSLSLSAGKGFSPYGTSDPMARPGLKYPTNHHLSQILERWTLNATWLRGRWSLEAGLLGGQEPDGPYDFSNIESFGDSWSVRVARRWGGGTPTIPEWQVSASFGSITEFAHTIKETTNLVNGALFHAGRLGSGQAYGLLEGSASFLEDHRNFFSVLAEGRYQWAGHRPYVRVEYARRPEYEREGPAGDDEFFHYHHDEDPVGTSRWLIATLGYLHTFTLGPWGVRPFAELQSHQVRGDQGGFSATDLFGDTSFWSLSVGARIFFGAGPMPMGSYGVLDAMTGMRRGMSAMGDGMPEMGGQMQPR